VLGRLLPRVIADELQAKLSALGVLWHLGTSAKTVSRVGDGFEIGLSNGNVLQADCVLSAIGLRPRTELAKRALKLLIEPINTYDIPGFFLSTTAQGIAILDEVGADNAFLQYDIYHAQRMEGELANTTQKHLARIGHMQLADNPGRNEPGTGEINYAFLFKFIDKIGYSGWIGCEYKPATTTDAGLGWLKSL
jgi:sugar phosphate isomerase/epimerase